MEVIRGKRRAVLAPLAVASLVLSLFPIVYLHVASAGQISPISHTISDYIFVANGTGLLAVTALSLAAGSVVLLMALFGAGLPRRGPITVLVGLWSAGLTAATVFPTDPTGTPTTFPGAVHRYAGAIMFVSLPLAGLLISRRFIPSTTVRNLAFASGITSFLFLLSHVPVVFPGNGALLLGLAERILFAVLYGLLFALAAALRRDNTRTTDNARTTVEVTA
ncbi:DUF998 domain-containing protein [Umezawaea sp. Da 62-37]|uniref:DUF998 domain-containing protein n=1 Tax=Umezawaea sp. Da 62-37 TaxID=3075927 RepID=UPI0028F6FACE|nr:DUF998 domain-containing protein [Umezawaea sp. Da 62-37]WNV84276.1 DUF998 domain-containing protein [Umezawaea sp. Da 62-37]